MVKMFGGWKTCGLKKVKKANGEGETSCFCCFWWVAKLIAVCLHYISNRAREDVDLGKVFVREQEEEKGPSGLFNKRWRRKCPPPPHIAWNSARLHSFTLLLLLLLIHPPITHCPGLDADWKWGPNITGEKAKHWYDGIIYNILDVGFFYCCDQFASRLYKLYS
jgi:hypothetical protein